MGIPRKQIEPARIAARELRLTCPECRSRVATESMASGRFSAQCLELDCSWVQYVEVGADGKAKSIDPFAIDPKKGVDPLKDPATGETKGFKPKNRRPQCSVEGCPVLSFEGGLCEAHDRSWRIAGRPEPRSAWVASQSVDRRRLNEDLEEEEESTEPTTSAAAGEERRTERVDPEPRKEPDMAKKKPPCTIAGCSNPSQGKGLCPKHYSRWRTAGQPPIEQFIADGGPTKGNRTAASEPAAPARRAGKPVTETPLVASADAPPIGKLIEFGEPVDAIAIGRMGRYLTLTTPDGRVLHQVDATEFAGGAA